MRRQSVGAMCVVCVRVHSLPTLCMKSFVLLSFPPNNMQYYGSRPLGLTILSRCPEQVLTGEGVESNPYSRLLRLTCCFLIQVGGRIWPAGRVTSMQVAFQVSQVHVFRAVVRSQRSVHKFTVSMPSCLPRRSTYPAHNRALARLVNPLPYAIPSKFCNSGTFT